jgi:outer membrane protein
MVAECRAEGARPVYVIDMQRIIGESVIGKAARNNMESEIKKSQGALDKAKIDLDAMKTQFEKQGALLSPDAAREKRAAVEKRERELGRMYQDQREELSRKNNSEIAKVVAQVDKVIEEMAKEKDYDFILEKNQRLVVYADRKFDLTDEVIKILDDRKVGL